MTNLESFGKKVMRRLETYLELDTTGIRHTILKIFLSKRKLSCERLHDILQKMNFSISLKSVSAILGIMHSRLGIFHAKKESYKTHTVYSLRPEYIGILKEALMSGGYSSNTSR